MKRISLSFIIVIAFILYSLRVKTERFLSDNTVRILVDSGRKEPVTFPVTISPLPEVKIGKYRDGVFKGKAEDAFFGKVRIQAVIRSGNITDIQFLDYPRDRSNSERISNASMPFLKSEAIEAQSAQVDIVTGATETSLAFIQSLDSALQNARTQP